MVISEAPFPQVIQIVPQWLHSLVWIMITNFQVCTDKFYDITALCAIFIKCKSCKIYRHPLRSRWFNSTGLCLEHLLNRIYKMLMCRRKMLMCHKAWFYCRSYYSSLMSLILMVPIVQNNDYYCLCNYIEYILNYILWIVDLSLWNSVYYSKLSHPEWSCTGHNQKFLIDVDEIFSTLKKSNKLKVNKFWN